jgi:hypothetical protein
MIADDVIDLTQTWRIYGRKTGNETVLDGSGTAVLQLCRHSPVGSGIPMLVPRQSGNRRNSP